MWIIREDETPAFRSSWSLHPPYRIQTMDCLFVTEKGVVNLSKHRNAQPIRWRAIFDFPSCST